MPRLYLLRHGIADGGGDDPDLSDEGVVRMELEARGMAALGLHFDAILSSPLRRAVSTARIVAREFGNGPVRVRDELGPGARLSALPLFSDAQQSVLLVGHAPDMGVIASALIGGKSGFPFARGGLGCVELARWPPAPPGMLTFLVTGEMLVAAAPRPV